MGINFIWLGSIALEFLILVRGVQTRLAKAYPLFYLYVACDLLMDLYRLWYRRSHSASSYDTMYWLTAPLLILISSLILYEIYLKLVAVCPGVERLAQEALLVAFALTALIVLAYSVSKSYLSPLGVWADFGADLRYLQGALLFVLLVVIARYHVSFSWNMQGISIGYALLVAVDVIYQAVLFRPGSGSADTLRAMRPTFYFLILLILTVAVWREIPALPRPQVARIEHDYQKLSNWMRISIDRVTRQIVRSIRR